MNASKKKKFEVKVIFEKWLTFLSVPWKNYHIISEEFE